MVLLLGAGTARQGPRPESGRETYVNHVEAKSIMNGDSVLDEQGPRKFLMKDIARIAGVSPMTVSRALKSDSAVATETRERVLKVIDELGYVPNQIAGGLSSKRSGFIAVLVPSLNNPHFADTVGALADVLHPSGLQILIGHTNYRSDQEEELIETMLRRKPEMIVLTYDGHTPRSRRMLEAARIPVIEIWEEPREALGHVVGFSNRKAARTLASAIDRKRLPEDCVHW